MSRRGRGDKERQLAIAEFAAAIRGEPGDPPGADARAGLVATWLAHAVYRSAQERAEIEVRV